ncbi:Reverse transcriptase zinc-binding domain [Sesbania bispinosa]|nr:Reverse transcriptase zinc-binding domain [Sesbania bispinosa]
MDQDTRAWKTDLIEASFLPRVANHILRIPLPTSPQEDKFCWSEVRSGTYNVKFGYHVALQMLREEAFEDNAHPTPPTFNWKKLWALPCQPKQLHFTWRLLRGTLPVRHNLIKRGVHCGTRCAWCENNAETEDHLFRDCSWAADAWAQSPLKLIVQTLPSGPLSNWINDLITTGPEETICLFIAVCHGLWFARNKFFFEDREVPLQSIFSKALESIKLPCCGADRQQPVPSSNSAQDHISVAPPMGWYKINVDAALKDCGNWGIGIVVRDSDGFVIAAASRKLETLEDVTLAEEMGLRSDSAG